VGGCTAVYGDLGVAGQIVYKFGASPGSILTGDVSGYASWTNIGLTTASGNIFIENCINTGCVSISNSLYSDGSAVFVGEVTVDGDLNVTGNVFALNVSDRRTKTAIRQLSDREIAEKAATWTDLPLYEYEYNSDIAPEHVDKTRKHVGFMAQDIATVAPTAVMETVHSLPTGEKIVGIDWINNIIPEEMPVLIKHLLVENKSMRDEIAELRTMVRDLARKLE
jgi:hypothetical protein